MKNNLDNKSLIASEIFEPSLSVKYMEKYKRLVNKLGKSLPFNRNQIISEEINSLDEQYEKFANDIDYLTYKASLLVLKDLSLQGWIFEIKGDSLLLKMENDNLVDKSHIRYRLSAECNVQFKNIYVRKFITYMEKPRMFNGECVSIKNLIGDKNRLIELINNKEKVCIPYVQLVSHKKDEYSGFFLQDIWRYFRYTWAIPYKTMPGRNLYYLVRDANQKFHPVIGIFALGNSVLNLAVRDDDIGWTLNSIKKEMEQKTSVVHFKQIVSKTDGKTINTTVIKKEESDEEWSKRINKYADKLIPLFYKNIKSAIDDIYVRDLGFSKQTKYPKKETIDELIQISKEQDALSINNYCNEKNPNWIDETLRPLFKKKRSTELCKLLNAQRAFMNAPNGSNLDKLHYLLSNNEGKKAITVALISNRKCKIGSNMMDIIVCGAIPPYNELLGGKLVSLLACSPQVIRDYHQKYKKQISEISSRMKGKKVIRDSHLAYLGTTSLYAIGSSQYNRIKVPLYNNRILEYKKMGITEGFGTVYFSSETSAIFSKISEIRDGGKRINYVFGEGTSPRLRIISKGLNSIGIKSNTFLKHYSPRIVYSIKLAANTDNYLLGFDKALDYGFNIDDLSDVRNKTQYLIDFWYNRWMIMRLKSVDIINRLQSFDERIFLLSSKL